MNRLVGTRRNDAVVIWNFTAPHCSSKEVMAQAIARFAQVGYERYSDQVEAMQRWTCQ